MKSRFGYSLELQDPALSDVPGVIGQLMSFLRVHGVLDELFLSQFELAATESINNAALHGCRGNELKFLRVRLDLNPDHVELRVTDPSSFEGWKKEALLPEDPLREGGRGYFIMSRMTDELLHDQENGCHVLVLRKRFSDTSWQYVPGEGDHIVSQMTDELLTSYEIIDTLVSFAKWLTVVSGIDAFMNLALEKLCVVTGAQSAYVRVAKGGEELLLHHLFGKPLLQPPVSVDIMGTDLEAEVFRSCKEITVPFADNLPKNDPLSKVMWAGFVIPILNLEENHGVMVLINSKPAPFFDAGKLKVARIVSEYLGIIISFQHLQKLRESEQVTLHDMEVAAGIQLSLMPHDFSTPPGLDFFGTSVPALQAGGDYFDILTLPDKSVFCLIADVMGKGLPAALHTIMVRSTLHALIAANECDPGRILDKINSLMCRDLIRLEAFITMVCIWISPDRKTVRSASAGHLSPFLQTTDGRISEIIGKGVPIGIFPDSSYSSTSIPFDPQSRILLYTDGISEALDEGNSVFEVNRIKECLSRSRQLSSRATVERLLEEVTTFSAGLPPSDDRTLILVTRTK